MDEPIAQHGVQELAYQMLLEEELQSIAEMINSLLVRPRESLFTEQRRNADFELSDVG